MIEYYSQRPYLIVILAVLLIFTIWVCIKAGKASSRRYSENRKIMEKMNADNELCAEFAVLTAQIVGQADPKRLFGGVALNIQKQVAAKDDMLEAFAALTQEQQEIYALYFVDEDGGSTLSRFFKINGEPLTTAAQSAVDRFFGGRASEIFEKERLAFDPDDETVSNVKEEIKAMDLEFASLVNSDSLRKTAGEFIAANLDRFI